RGAARYAQGDVAGALADFDRALQIDPLHGATYNNRGSARHAAGDLAGALADFDRALQMAPRHTSASVYHNRGGVFATRRDFRAAILDYDQALEIDPRFCVAYISRGGARYHLGDPAGHLDFHRACTLNAELAASEILRLVAQDIRDDPRAVL